MVIDRAINNMNYGFQRTGQDDLKIIKIVVSSLADIKNQAEKGKKDDRFILNSHGSGTGIFIGGTHYEWSNTQLRETLEAFKGKCKTLTFHVCHISEEQAKDIQDLTGVDDVFFNPGEDIIPMPGFGFIGINPVGGGPGSSYEYDPPRMSRTGMRCLCGKKHSE